MRHLTPAQQREMATQLETLLREGRLAEPDEGLVRWMLATLELPGRVAGRHLRQRHQVLTQHARRLSPRGRQLLVLEAPAVAAWVSS